LGFTTLETRRLRGNLIEVLKIFKGYDDLQPSKFFNLSTNLTRGHSFKLFKGRLNLDCRKFVFSRVIDVWNSRMLDAGTIRYVSSAYLDITLPGVIGLRSDAVTTYDAGPIADHCTILASMSLTLETFP